MNGVASNFQDITTELFPARTGEKLLNPTSLGEDVSGELYIVDITAGNVFKITGQWQRWSAKNTTSLPPSYESIV